MTLPVRNVIDFDDPRMVSTTKAIAAELDAGNGLLFRYLPSVSPDGLPGNEGAFLLCSFWLVDNLAGQGRVDEAHELYESLCSRANSLGLLPEQIHPDTGEFLGNFPQAFSHVGVLASGLRLLKAERRPQRLALPRGIRASGEGRSRCVRGGSGNQLRLNPGRLSGANAPILNQECMSSWSESGPVVSAARICIWQRATSPLGCRM
ncbi:trehalase [Arthrobacter sp. Hiyo8]|nr:trehalase [Arthrobacter sp. Hiyo8]